MWIESHQSLRDHPKKDRLAELLFNGTVPIDVADYAAIGVLHELWWWALDYAPDGDLSKFTDRQVAKGCRWYGDATLLVKALGEAHFIDRKTCRIHDWDEYAGKLLAKRKQDRDRKRVQRTSAGNPSDGAGTDLPTYLKRDKVPKKPVDNCPVCAKEHSEIPLTPDEEMRPHCSVCGYTKRRRT